MMLDHRDWKTSKPQCIHHNDADNCYACGTGRVSQGPNAAFGKGVRYTGEYVPSGLCRLHGFSQPCIQCEAEALARGTQERNRLVEVARINEVSKRIWAALDAEKFAQAWPAGGKCAHGVYVAEHYCSFCSIEILEPDYDRNRFRQEINKALGAAKTNFHAGGYYPGKDDKEVLTESEKNFQDLLGLVDLEIWKASRHYGDKMSGVLAATIAKNTAGRFTAEIIQDTTVVTNIEWAAMPQEFREKAFALFIGIGGDIQEFVRLSKDDRASKVDRELAKTVIHDYGTKGPRFLSMDVPTEFADGTNDGDSTSRAEYEVHENQSKQRSMVTEGVEDITEQERMLEAGEVFDAHREGLEALVKTWRGELRKVGEAMLAGTFTVRGVPGVKRDMASRLYQKVVQAFRAHIEKQP